MKFDIITIFPEIFDFYLNQSLLGKAQKNKVFKVKAHNLRDFTNDKHKTVDDKPFGGGRGMVLKIGPVYKAIKKIKAKKGKTKVVLFSPRGKKFDQKMATNWSKLDQLVLICGRYEAIDERVIKFVDEVVSIGDYVLMGGELPALVMMESIIRLLPGAVGNSEALIEERITKDKAFTEYPQYTRPEIFEANGKKLRAPKVLLSGDHKKIQEWRDKHTKIIGK